MTAWQTSIAAAVAFTIVAVAAVSLTTRPATDDGVGAEAMAWACPGEAADPATESSAELPLGLAIVCLDGSLGRDLGLTRDAWAADLSPDGSHVVFRTSDLSVGFCGGCSSPVYLAFVELGSTTGPFLVNTGATDIGQAAWSPDGKRVAYQKEKDGNVDIYVTDLDPLDEAILSGDERDEDAGVDATTIRLTDDPAIDEFPAWTPDGTTILYSNMGSEPPDESGFSPTQAIWSAPADGGTSRRLSAADSGGTMPDVAPDGTVAYFSGNGEIWTMGLDGSDPAPLGIDPGGRSFSPRWSPDGSKLAVLRYDPRQHTMAHPEAGIDAGLALLDVVVIDLSTGDVSDIGPRVATDDNPPSWTPDGKALLVNRYLAD